jgi:hypothetical protein
MPEWTVARVRRELPDVPVKYMGMEFVGRVTGRNNPVATVAIWYDSLWFSAEVAWDTVAFVLNNDAMITF